MAGSGPMRQWADLEVPFEADCGSCGQTVVCTYGHSYWGRHEGRCPDCNSDDLRKTESFAYIDELALRQAPELINRFPPELREEMRERVRTSFSPAA